MLWLSRLPVESILLPSRLERLHTVILDSSRLYELPAALTSAAKLRKLSARYQRGSTAFQLPNNHTIIDPTAMPHLDSVDVTQGSQHQWSFGSLVSLSRCQAQLWKAKANVNLIYKHMS